MQNGNKRKPENDLLYRLDLEYRLRRIQFVQQMINQLLVGAMAIRDHRPVVNPIDQLLAISETPPDLNDREQNEAFQRELKRIKVPLNKAYNTLRDAGRTLRTRGLLEGDKVSRWQAPEAYILKVRELNDLLKQKDQTSTEAWTGKICQVIEDTSLVINANDPNNPGFLGQALSTASREGRDGFKNQEGPSQTGTDQTKRIETQNAAKEIAEFLYDHYEFYDMVTYPIMYGTPQGESSIVDVFRISPQDAPSIIDESRENRKKLLGNKFANFGAFFEKDWRENDMLWGRLDGAECLINAVLPGESDEKKLLLLQAQDAILTEDFLPQIREQATDSDKLPLPGVVNGKSALVQTFRDYQVNGNFPQDRIEKLAIRIAPVVGMLLAGMEDRRKYMHSFAVWIPRLGRAYGASIKIRDFLHLPWTVKKQAAGAKEKVVTAHT